MTEAAAVYSFWAGFGIPAYEETIVPTGDNAPDFPYITYQFASETSYQDALMVGSVWYRGTSWKEANQKAEEIRDYVDNMKKPIAFDKGRLWIKAGSFRYQNMGDESDDMIRRNYMTITAERFAAR